MQEIKIAERIPHPSYITNKRYHDIALLRLEHPAEITPYSIPACLHLEYNTHTARAIATGWGLTIEAGYGSNELMKVTLDLVGHNFCNSQYKFNRNSKAYKKLNNGIIDNQQLCAGSEGKDTCQVRF